LALALACSRAVPLLEAAEGLVPPASSAATPPAVPDRPALLAPYPRATWRLARPELGQVVFWLSHLLVRHENVTSEVSFSQAGWRSLPAPSRRRSEALALARSIAEQARRDPGGFAALARLHSEDTMTRERGGSLGGVTALHLSSWSQVLDALAVVRSGEVSDVVETEYGFHVLLRRPPPPEQTVSGARIVIGHDQAPFLRQLTAAALPSRTREDALAISQEIYAALVEHPERFQELVKRHSEHPDAALGGDLGQWSSWEPTEYSRQLEVLAELDVGEIAAPIETLLGWEILVRTPNRPRQVYAMTPLEVPVSLVVSDDDAARSADAAALARAWELARLVQREPGRFAELQKRHCCEYVAQWSEGKGWPPLIQVLQGLKLGEIAAEPVSFGLGYVVPQRVAPRPEAAERAHFELPSPSEPDLGYLFQMLPTKELARQLGVVNEQARTSLELPAETLERLRELQDSAWRAADAQLQAREPALAALQARTIELLGRSKYAGYVALTKQHFKAWIMDAR
jgi:hypothetical protein